MLYFMEYVEGTDLDRLMRVRKNLTFNEKRTIIEVVADTIGHAHRQFDLIHRDIKPSNVLVAISRPDDPILQSHIKLTDFGIARVLSLDQRVTMSSGMVMGTVQYMAPEQFAGKGASIRSDIYALGLIFYELYTGRKAFTAPTTAELRAMKESATPTAPSEIAREIDPIVERVILRCMEKDPRQRPASVAQVAAALPGGDPLAAAIAAGETPSPEMVAASGSTEGLKPWVAWACLAFVIVGIIAAAFLVGQVLLYRRVEIENSPEVMAAGAREILMKAGYPQRPVDSVFGLSIDWEYLSYVRENDRTAGRWDSIPSSVIGFWYRQSPRSLVHRLAPRYMGWGIGAQYLPLTFSGESIVELDARGRLMSFQVIPPERDESADESRMPDWTLLFEAAGLDPAQWTAAAPGWNPPLYADSRTAWTGIHPDRSDVPMRIEAAAHRGKPVFWRLIAPWNRPSRMAPSSPSLEEKAGYLLGIILVIAMALAGAFFARRNLRLGRGDRRGAARLAYLVLILFSASWIVGEHHVPELEEFSLFLMFLSWSLLVAGFLWLLYIALEPFVRRRWPGALVSWSRLFAGNFRDPLVGRDLLAGCVAGVGLCLLECLGYRLASRIGIPEAPFTLGGPEMLSLLGTRALLEVILSRPILSLFWALATLFLLFLLRVLLRREWVAALAFILVLTVSMGLGSDSPITWIFYALKYAVVCFLLVRFGLLANTAHYAVYFILFFFPITPQLSAWYAGTGIAGVVLILAFTAYAFHTSLGGRPMFRASLLED